MNMFCLMQLVVRTFLREQLDSIYPLDVETYNYHIIQRDEMEWIGQSGCTNSYYFNSSAYSIPNIHFLKVKECRDVNKILIYYWLMMEVVLSLGRNIKIIVDIKR